MQIVLLREIAGIGRKGEVKNVAEGHARNFLIPRGFAAPATPKHVKALEAQYERSVEEKELQADLLLKNITSLNGTTIIIEAKANEKGHLFKGIHRADIAAAIQARAHFEIPADVIELPEPIKEIGEREIVVSTEDRKSVV